MKGGWGTGNQASLPIGSRILIIILSSHWPLVRASTHKVVEFVSHWISFNPPSNHNALDTTLPTLEGNKSLLPAFRHVHWLAWRRWFQKRSPGWLHVRIEPFVVLYVGARRCATLGV